MNNHHFEVVQHYVTFLLYAEVGENLQIGLSDFTHPLPTWPPANNQDQLLELREVHV
jgi:hypothetical protein|tara:strand:+ start:786 stop:956 length:171 start_codon:yes stop_codon:yes gene_type:complete